MLKNTNNSPNSPTKISNRSREEVQSAWSVSLNLQVNHVQKKVGQQLMGTNVAGLLVAIDNAQVYGINRQQTVH